MKKSVLIGGILMIFLIGFSTALAAFQFTDTQKFSNWYKEAVANMWQKGVIQGYPDGSFKPENSVNRAELAVMFDRLEKEMTNNRNDYVQEGIEEVLTQYDKLTSQNIDHKVWIAMAEAGFKKLSAKPNIAEFTVAKDVKLPPGYTLYENRYIIYTYYLNYKGERIEGDISTQVDDWFGPFF